MRLLALTLLLGSGAVVANPNPGTGGAPFSVRDENPLLAGFGLPSAMPAHMPDGWTAGMDISWGSTALLQENDDEVLLVDAETREARLTLHGAISDRLGWQLQLPYRYTGGGSLDSFIDSWHDFFGLAEGVRPLLPSDQVDIIYIRDDARRVNFRSSAEGLADIQAALGYQMHASAESALMAWLSVKLPTGDADELTGSGATDVSLLLSGQHRLSDRWSVFGQAAATWLGDGDLLVDQQRSVVWSAVTGVSVRTWRGLSFKAQIDAHSAAYDSDLDFFSEAVVFTIGGDYRFASGWRLDLGVSEDLAVEHSPDVVFVMSLKQRW